MMKYKYVVQFSLIFILFATNGMATDYSVNVSRIEQNFYEDSSSGVIIQTRYCYEYAYWEDAILQIDSLYGYTIGKLIFNGGGIGNECDVDRVLEEYNFVVSPPPQPNLTVYQPSAWPSPLSVFNELGEVIDTQAYTNNSIYVSWAAQNISDFNVNSSFYVTIYLDNELKESWVVNELSAGYYTFIENFDLGQLSEGEHVILLVIDTLDSIAESNENDNSLSKTINIIVLDQTAPTGSVSYSTTDPTNNSVIATLQTSEGVTITSSGGNSHTFTNNGSFTFSFQDAAGNTGSATATVSNIDKIAPTIVLTGAPSGIATLSTFEITVSGGDVIQYRFKLDNGVYGSITDVGINIGLNNLTEGPHTLYVIGKDNADNWQAEIDATIISWEIVFLGNLNGDDKVDLADAIIALKVLSGIDTTGLIRSDYAASGADVNGDNKIGMQEVVYILQKFSGLRSE